MADKLAPLNDSSSYATLLRAIDSASTPLAIRLLRTTHTGRVIEDGLAKGVQGLLSSVVGLPKDLYEFAAERIRGTKSATPEAERVMSSAWLDKKMEGAYTEQQRILGRERPKLREGTTDGLVHVGAQFVPLVGSFFIPGVGQTQLATAGAKYGKAAELVGKVAGNAGFQLNALDLTTIGIAGAEKLAGVERPTEVAKAAPQSTIPPLIKSGIDTTAVFSDASTGTVNTGSKVQAAAKVPAATAKFEM
jgi:hypothetical protein